MSRADSRNRGGDGSSPAFLALASNRRDEPSPPRFQSLLESALLRAQFTRSREAARNLFRSNGRNAVVLRNEFRAPTALKLSVFLLTAALELREHYGQGIHLGAGRAVWVGRMVAIEHDGKNQALAAGRGDMARK